MMRSTNGPPKPVERSVRISGARDGQEDRCSRHAADHLPAALLEFLRPDGNAYRHAVVVIRARERVLADVVARLQPVGPRRRRLHRVFNLKLISA